MKLAEVVDLLDAKIVCGEIGNHVVETGFSSDLMSDVLTLDTDKMLLITGLTNLQTIRTAEMADIQCIIFVRKKKAGKELIELAKDNGMILLETPFSLFRASGELYKAGLKPVY